MYFVDCGDETAYYDTEQEAREAADKCIDSWRDCCDPDWPEEVERVCWGKVMQSATAVPIKYEHDTTEFVDYQLTDVTEAGGLGNKGVRDGSN